MKDAKRVQKTIDSMQALAAQNNQDSKISAGEKTPRHIAIIMDGNGRWATSRHLPRTAGHKAGLKTITQVTECAFNHGVEIISFFALSTENFRRPAREVSALLSLLKKNLPPLTKKLSDKGITTVFSGDFSAFGDELCAVINDCGGRYVQGKPTVNICLNYGGKSEIVRAAYLIAGQIATGQIANGEKIDEEGFRQFLYQPLPDPDLLIRTGGEKRLSNFMLYQCAYTELYFSEVLWPDFDGDYLKAAIADYSTRNRRFGGLQEEKKK